MLYVATVKSLGSSPLICDKRLTDTTFSLRGLTAGRFDVMISKRIHNINTVRTYIAIVYVFPIQTWSQFYRL